MRIRNQIFLLASVAFVAAACSDDNPWGGEAGKGGIHLDLAADGNVKDAVPLLRSGSTAPDVPAPEDFSVTLTKKSTGEVSEYATLEEFNNASGFTSGGYTVAAHFGTADTEGFGTPYYLGQADVTVLDNKTQDVAMTATLASSMVSIDYTDAFKTYFKEYGATVHSEGHGYIDFGSLETRPAYIAPGDVTLTVHMTNASGKTADIQPSNFAAEAAHHYHITLDVNNGNVGQAQLVISFDETLDKENVEIDLTDELFTSAAPSIATIGFSPDQTFESVEGSTMPEKLKFNVACPGGFKSATLTIAGEGFNPGFGKEVDLCALSADQLAAMKEYGINEVRGFDPSTGKYALLDISGLPAHLPSGTFDITLQVQDKFLRVSDPVKVRFTSIPVAFDIAEASALQGSTSANIDIEYNGLNPGNDVTFEAMSRTGVYQPCQILDMQMTRSRAVETHTYRYTVKLPDTDRPEIPLKVYLSGMLKQETTVKVITPEYSTRADAFSTFAAIKVDPKSASDLSLITKSVRIFLNDEEIAASRLSRNESTGVITVTGLAKSTGYSLKTTLFNDLKAADIKDAVSFRTENADALANGGFDETHLTINMENVNSGGKYKAGVKKECYNTETIRINEPTDWASLNPLTCWSGSSTINSWFTVPSTYEENGAVVIRSVAYDHNGTEPAYKNWGTFTYNYYNNNLPASIASRSSGELIYGTYSFDGSEHRSPASFTCRPSSISFDYSYAPVGNEVGSVTVTVLASDGSVVAAATNDLAASSSMKTHTMQISGYTFGAKATHLEIVFRSTKGNTIAVNMPSSGNIDGVSGVAPTSGGFNLGVNASKSLAIGSVLRVDNVKLNY